MEKFYIEHIKKYLETKNSLEEAIKDLTVKNINKINNIPKSEKKFIKNLFQDINLSNLKDDFKFKNLKDKLIFSYYPSDKYLHINNSVYCDFNLYYNDDNPDTCDDFYFYFLENVEKYVEKTFNIKLKEIDAA